MFLAGAVLGGSLAPLVLMIHWAMKALGFSCLGLALLGLLALRAKSPLADLRANMAKHREGMTAFALLIAFMAILFVAKNLLVRVNGFHAEVAIADLDALIHGGDAWRFFRPVMFPAALNVIAFAYHPLWALLTIGFTFFACLREDRSRYVWSFLLTWVLLGNITALIGFSGGPIYYEHITGDPRFRELTDFLAQSTSPSHTQAVIWDMWTNGGVSAISAFPSMHVASTTLFALYAFTVSRPLGWALTAFKLFIMAASVYLGWHYAIDGYASTIGTTLIWYGVGYALKQPTASQRNTVTA